jgi:lysophospholipase L1-like esterase
MVRRLILCFIVITIPAAAQTKRAHDFARWENAIAKFEEADKKNPPPKNALLFVGSSTIVRWKTLAQDFPEYKVLNRGFGGNEIVDSTHFADRIIFPYEPKMVLLRAGSNDIHAGKSADEVFGDFKDFVKTVHAKLSDVDVVFIGLFPAPVRWADLEPSKKLNELVEQYAQTEPHVKYIDCWDISITPDGKPREELFVNDRLHPNADGYNLLTARVREFLKNEGVK